MRNLITMPEKPSNPKTVRPADETVRGYCPLCHRPVVSERVYTTGKGYLIIWACLGKKTGDCDFAKVL